MAISETQLETWSHQGSVTQSASTYAAVRGVLDHPNAPYHAKNYNIFLQGSYGNSTNIYSESDVDIVICLTSSHYYDLKWLNEAETAAFNANLGGPATYTLAQFKTDVIAWLKSNYGTDVDVGSKAIRIKGNNHRRDADVLVCMETRLYRNYSAYNTTDYHAGIRFNTAQGRAIVNYPIQHKENCTAKHGGTYSRFKPNVRIFKNMRNAMATAGYIDKSRAPSYFIEGMLWNVPNTHFQNGYQATFKGCLNWLESSANVETMNCANNIHYLIRDGAAVCWNVDDFRATLQAYRRYWNA